tara:strand:+ start:248 stop:1156 length:909 start_codon:yes stop_codon:yes gene_type:complete
MPINYDNGIVDHAGGFTHPDQLKGAGLASGVYKFNTPDGGVQDGYFLNCSGDSQGGDQGWVLVGRWPAPLNGSASLKSNLDSVRGMADVSRTGTARWSADWGSMHIKEFRIITYSSSDGSDILGTRGLDFIYRIEGPGMYNGEKSCDTRLYNWISNCSHDDPGIDDTEAMSNRAVSNSKAGFHIYGARDGFGNWTNPNLKEIRQADPDSTHNIVKRAGFIKPQSNMWCMWFKEDGTSDGSKDAKWSVSSTDTDCGQDTDQDGKVGYDDNAFAHYYNPGTNRGDNNTTISFAINQFCCTAWIR